MLMTINNRRRSLVASLWLLVIAAALTSVRAKADDQMPYPISATAQWLNSPPLSVSDLRGKVVLVEFWAYDCVNCQRTLPYIKAWSAKYRQNGLLVVGVHTPEFGYEKDKDNVEHAVRALGITYPVVMDNQYEIWNAYKNTYWPAQYLMDAQGRQRYQHFGEGGYPETERMIQILLAEAHQGASSSRQ